MSRTSSALPSVDAWAVQWSQQTVALLSTLHDVARSGVLPKDPVVAAAFEDDTIDDAVSSHFRAVLEQPAAVFDAATRLALDQLLERQDLDAANSLGEKLHAAAVRGWWVQQVPLGQSTCGALEGESLLIGLGVFMNRGKHHGTPCLESPDHVEHLKALMLADYQLSNAFRVVLLPVMLGTPQTAAADAWQVSQLRQWLESWAEQHPVGHPGVDESRAALARLGFAGDATRYVDLAGRTAQPGQSQSLMDVYTLVGLVLHSPQDPVNYEALTEQDGPLSAMLFPRSDCASVLADLEAERDHIEDMLSSRMLEGPDLAEVQRAKVRCDADLRELRAVYGACLLPPRDPQAARPNGAGALVHQLLFEALGTAQASFLLVVASASAYYDSLRPSREALRYLRLRTMLNHAGGTVGLETSAGLHAEVVLDDRNHQSVLHLHHPLNGAYAGTAFWPLLAWESANDYLRGLKEALEEAGVTRVESAGVPAGGLH